MTDKTCTGCYYESYNEEHEQCENCSRLDDFSCSCHINPPCSVCVNDHYTEEGFDNGSNGSA